MSRLISNGFELNSTGTGEISTTTVSGGGAVSVSTTNVRTGTYAFRATNAGASGIARANLIFGTAGNGPYYGRMYLYIVALPGATNNIMAIWDGTTVRSSIKLTTTGTLQLFDSAGQIGSASSALSTGVWYRLELKYFNNTGTVKSELDARLDGVSFASTTTSTNVGTADRLSIGMVSASTAYDLYFDDVALNDGVDPGGGQQMSFPGAGQLQYLRPNGVGDNSSWTPSAGANYTNVDEITPNDATDFVASSTLNQIDDYTIDASPITATDVINVVHVAYRANRSAGTVSSAAVPRIKAVSGGTVAEGSAETASSTTWRSNDLDTNNALPFALTSYEKPSTGVWTQADLAASQIGMRLSTAGDRAFQTTAVWLVVDSTPSTSLGVSVSDSITVTESAVISIIGNSALSISTSDSVTVSESISKVVESSIAKSESITLTESLARLLESNIPASDSIAVTESKILLIPDLFVTKSDSITVSESRTVLVSLADLGVIVTPGIQNIGGVRIV